MNNKRPNLVDRIRSWWAWPTETESEVTPTSGSRYDEKRLAELWARLELEQAKKDQLVANISHELRGSANAIIGLLQVLEDQYAPDENAGRTIGQVQRTAAHMSAILDDLLDLAQLQAGKLRLRLKVFDLRALVEDTVTPYVFELQSKGVAFDLIVDPELPQWVEGDPIRLRQILMNLLGNATKFTSHGGVKLQMKPKAGEPGLVESMVEDTGIGIEAAQLRRIFDRFGAVASESAAPLRGAGIGLSLTKHLVTLMNGQIQAQSEPGRGSAFTFVLPMLARPAPSSHRRVDQKEPTKMALSARALLVEDNAINRVVTKQLLQRELPGLQIDEATDGGHALRLSAEGHYELILMDVTLPDMSGIAVTERLHAIRGMQTPPILGLTADPNPELHQRCLAAGMREVYLKPYNAAELAGRIVRWIGSSVQG
jgi:signal transduction histidine kinase/CheY-like chemotaxis protein